MAVYPVAVYRPLNEFSNVGTKPRVGVVLHVNDSDGPSLYNWIAGNNNMSCHFQVAKDGTVEQYIDTDNGSWCQMAGNDTYLSIETQGFPTEPLTDAQVQACAGIVWWLNETHSIPLVIADEVGEPGLGWHGMGGADWGGHTGCPGDLRAQQRPAILAAAGPAVIPAPVTPSDTSLEDEMYLLFAYADTIWVAPLSLEFKRTFSSPAALTRWQTDAAALGAKFKSTEMDAVTASAIPTGAKIA